MYPHQKELSGINLNEDLIHKIVINGIFEDEIDSSECDNDFSDCIL